MIEPIILHAYVDGELSEAESRDIEARLAQCAESRAEVASIRSMKSMVYSIPASDCQDAWANCQSRLDALDRVRKSGNFITKYSWAFVAAVAAFIVIGGGISRHAQAGVVDNSSLAGFVSSSSRQSPEQKIQNAQLDQILRDANNNLTRPKLVGASRIVQNNQVAERLDFVDGIGNFTLLVLPERSSFDDMAPDDSGKYFFGKIDGTVNAVGWRSHNACYVIVGDREFTVLKQLAETKFVLPD